MLNSDLEKLSSMTKNILYIGESDYQYGFMIMINIYTEFEYSRIYSIFED